MLNAAAKRHHPSDNSFLPLRGINVKILITASSYPKNHSDWRSVFIRHMASSLARREDIEVDLYAPPGELPPQVHSVVPASDSEWLSRLMEMGGVAHLLRNHPFKGVYWGARLSSGLYHAYRRQQRSDLFHVNWLQCALFIPDKLQTPLLVTVLGSDFGLLKHPVIVKRLRSVFKQRRSIIAPNADWMEPRLNQLFGDVATIRTVAFGIDKEWFDLQRKPDTTTNKWLAIVRVTRKKIGPLFSWGEKIFSAENQLHLIGPMQETIEIPSWVHYHGPSDPQTLRSQWFPDAAGLVTLSEHDEGRPQIMLEAMAAGMPIIASPLAAHKELIVHGETGFIIDNEQSFIQAIIDLQKPTLNQQMGTAARSSAKHRFGTWDECAARYVRLYRELRISE